MAADAPLADAPRRNHVGTVSLAIAALGALASRLALTQAAFADSLAVQVIAAGFEAALVGGLADWFAVTALFRHPLGLPIPHTAILPKRRDRLIAQIVAMVEDEWLAPEVIGERLQRIAPSEMVVDWLRDPEHVRRLGDPIRDLLRTLAAMVTEPELAEFAERAAVRQLRELPLDAQAGGWLARVVDSEAADAAFRSAALSLRNVMQRPVTADRLEAWIDRAARQLHEVGQRLVPLVLRRKLVQRKLVEAICEYATSELQAAADQSAHPLRELLFGGLRRFAERLAEGDAGAVARVEQVRAALVESLEARPLVATMLRQLRAQLEHDLADPDSALAQLIERELHGGILDLLADPQRRARFDGWVQTTARDLLQRHHHHIGQTVRESLEALDTDTLVARVEDRVGSDLQYIRLNGAVVGGLIGVLIALAHHFAAAWH